MKKLQKSYEIICIIAISIMIVTVFTQVVGRYVFHWSLSWGEELTRFLLVWISFLGVALAAKKKAHINIDAFINMLSPKAKKVVGIFDDVLTCAFWLYVGLSGISMAVQNGDQLSPAMKMPMNIVYIAIPVGSFLLILFTIEEYWNRYAKKTKENKGE